MIWFLDIAKIGGSRLLILLNLQEDLNKSGIFEYAELNDHTNA